MLRVIALSSLVITLSTISNASEFKIQFDWSGLKLCTSGNPDRVSNPQFVISGLPEGTEYVQFKLVDRDVPGYNHGGGTVKISADGKVPSDAFKYKSPCRPNGSHKYQWTATAKNKKGWGAKKLGVAKATRKYPE